MFNDKSRSFVEKMDGLFDLEIIMEIHNYFLAVESDRQSTVNTDREKRMLRIGAGSDALRLDSKWYDLWRNWSFKRIDMFRPYTWIVFPPQVRHITEPSHLVPWHQDLGYQKLLGSRAHNHIITCFVPVELDPSSCAGLEFAVGEFEPFSHNAKGDHGASITEREFSKVKHFDLKFGDALVFGDLCPHRTCLSKTGKIDRRSFEFRLIRREDAIDGKDYFDLEQSCFVRTDGSRRDKP